MDGAGSAIISSRHLKVKAPGVWPLLHIPGRSLEPRGLIARPRQGGDGSRRSQDSGAATDVPPTHNHRKTDSVLDAGPRTDRRQPRSRSSASKMPGCPAIVTSCRRSHSESAQTAPARRLFDVSSWPQRKEGSQAPHRPPVPQRARPPTRFQSPDLNQWPSNGPENGTAQLVVRSLTS
jgi:hypothetical protein